MDQLRLLIIEDDVGQLELMSETLEEHFGPGTVLAVEGRREAMQTDLARFDLILLDHGLRDGTAMLLLEQITRRCSTPVLLVTAENVGTAAADAVRKGASDYVVKSGEYLFTLPLVVEKNLTLAKIKRENESLRQELEQALKAVRDKNAELQESLRLMEEMAATDPLTKLCNRRHFDNLLEQRFAEAQRYDTDLTCVMIDLDGYKRLNDTHGHQVGDELLVLAGRVIQANMRQMDVAARYGGDEFVLLFPQGSAAVAVRVADRIREEYRSASGAFLRGEGVGMSAGVASLRQHRPAHADQLVAMADAGLYQAKAAGRNRTSVAEMEGAGT